jgi:hypothetical protein
MGVAERQARFREQLRALAEQPARLPSGRFVDRCPDCGTVTVGSTQDEVDGARCACTPIKRQSVYLVELVCSMCSRRLGDAVAASPSAPMSISTQLRCSFCGGQPWPSGYVDARDITRYPAVHIDAPRRGRPPTRLAEQRRRPERSA